MSNTQTLRAPEAALDPHRLARQYLKNYATHMTGKPVVRYWRQEWWLWMDGRYRTTAEAEMAVALTRVIKAHIDRNQLIKRNGDLFSVTKNHDRVLDAPGRCARASGITAH